MEFVSEEAAEKSYAMLKDTKLRGTRQLVVDYVGEKSSYVKKAQDKKSQEGQKREPDLKRLHFGGIDKATKEADIKKLLTSAVDAGSLLEFVMPVKSDKKNPEVKVNMGFAFAAFSSEADAKKALEAVNGKQLNGKAIKVDYAFQRTASTPTPNKQKDAVCTPSIKNRADYFIIYEF